MEPPKTKKEKKSTYVEAPGAAKRLALLVEPYGIRYVEAYESLGSTMEAARAHHSPKQNKPSLFWAASQTRGRGRRGNQWESPEGGSYFTLVLPQACKAEDWLPQLALMAGVALAECIHEWTECLPCVKWPNDVLLNDKKVAGILIESHADAVFVGVGVNVNTATDALPDHASSLLAQTERPYGVLEITAAMCERLIHWNRLWRAEGFGPVRAALLPILAYSGHPVRFNTDSDIFESTLVGVDERGCLQLREESGIVRTVETGEVSLLRPIDEN